MHIDILYPNYMTVGGDTYEVNETDVRVEIEPDESVGCTHWYVSKILIEARVRGKWQMVPVPKGDPMFVMLKTWAQQEYRPQFEELWSDYLADKPKRKRPLSDIAEHGTHFGGVR